MKRFLRAGTALGLVMACAAPALAAEWDVRVPGEVETRVIPHESVGDAGGAGDDADGFVIGSGIKIEF